LDDPNGFVDKILFTKEDLVKSSNFMNLTNEAILQLKAKDVARAGDSLNWYNTLHRRMAHNVQQQIDAKNVKMKVIDKDEEEMVPLDHLADEGAQ